MLRIIVTIALGLISASCAAQAVKPGPEDLRRNVQAATDAVTMETAGTPPFHVEASFETFDFEGKPEGSGTLVEDWLNPGTKRRTISFRGVTWTQVAHAGSVHSSGDSFEGSFLEAAIINALLTPGPRPTEIAGGKPEYKLMKVGTVSLDCTLLTPVGISKEASPEEHLPTAYCLSQTPLLLRLVQQHYDLLTTYNRFAKLGTHSLPEAVTISSGARTRATLKVTTFRVEPSLKESDFSTSGGPDTSEVEIHVDGGVMKGEILSKIAPRYPEEDKQHHVAGSVYLNARIDKTGSIAHLEVINAPSGTMAQSALTAVRQWKYKPYLQNGEPTNVDTIITVNYSFGPPQNR